MDLAGLALFGLVATTALTAVMIAAQLAGRTRLDLPLVRGTVVTGDPDRARVAGFFIHLAAGQGFALSAGGPLLYRYPPGCEAGLLDPTPTVDEPLMRADLAMYVVKRRGEADVLLHEEAERDALTEPGCHLAQGLPLFPAKCPPSPSTPY